MIARRSRAAAYLLLSRVSNLPTVWTNVLAGLTVAAAPMESAGWLALSASLFYTGGMFLNDAFDAPFDARVRRDRPIPSGDVSRTEVFVVGGALILAGEVLLWTTSHRAIAAVSGVALALAIVFYDWRHKGRAYGPLVMGLCRALVYVMAAAAASSVTLAVIATASVMWAYVVGLTLVAKRVGPAAGRWVPRLLAGICLVDAVVILRFGSAEVAAIAAAGFFLTLALQRVVPGT